MENTLNIKNTKEFLKKKNIDLSAKAYLIDGLSMMALGLFSSLIVGLIIKTFGEIMIDFFGDIKFFQLMISTGEKAMSMMGAAIGAATAFGLKSPPLVIFSSIATGSLGAVSGGPAGAFIASLFGAEFGKAISKETKVDIILTPITTILIGSIVSIIVSPVIGKLMTDFGKIIMISTKFHPFFFGMIISVLMGLLLTAPVSSAAIAIMLNLSGLAGGCATVGCCCQMIGFSLISYKDNNLGVSVAQGLGTSMLQISNIIKNPWILLPPTLASLILGPVSTMIFKMTNNSIGSGMGTSGLVGQIGTFNTMGFSLSTILKILILHIILPGILSLFFYKILKNKGKIKKGDYKLDI